MFKYWSRYVELLPHLCQSSIIVIATYKNVLHNLFHAVRSMSHKIGVLSCTLAIPCCSLASMCCPTSSATHLTVLQAKIYKPGRGLASWGTWTLTVAGFPLCSAGGDMEVI